MSVTLAVIYHDPQGRLFDQTERVLPTLTTIFGAIVVRGSSEASSATLQLFQQAGALVYQEPFIAPNQPAQHGRARRKTVELALSLPYPTILYCDGDRALHWAEHYPQELAAIAEQIQAYDFTVLGRTPRAFASHPRNQRDTEAIINHLFQVTSSHAWDVTAAARGLSRRAAEFIVAESRDDEISTDVSWPLLIQQRGGFTQSYVETEGLEFETLEQVRAEVERLGGAEAWIAQVEASPRAWAQRLDLARIEVEALIPFTKP